MIVLSCSDLIIWKDRRSGWSMVSSGQQRVSILSHDLRTRALPSGNGWCTSIAVLPWPLFSVVEWSVFAILLTNLNVTVISVKYYGISVKLEPGEQLTITLFLFIQAFLKPWWCPSNGRWKVEWFYVIAIVGLSTQRMAIRMCPSHCSKHLEGWTGDSIDKYRPRPSLACLLLLVYTLSEDYI